ncbi:MAG: DUF6527 family protein [Pirellulales bacterium]
MIRYHRLEHRFFEHIPEQLEPGVLYISMEYGTAAHLCCCGCGAEVITPFTPTDWKMTFDGETVSLRPSVGNWSLPCRSHYVIERGRVTESMPWSDKQVAAERRRDKAVKDQYYGTPKRTEAVGSAPAPTQPSNGVPGLWSRITRRLFGLWK